jgi:hypothetical protein
MAFDLYNMMFFKNQPDLSGEGLKAIGHYDPKDYDPVKAGRWASEHSEDLLIIDFEPLCSDVRVQSAECVAQGHQQRIDAIRAARRERRNPASQIGTYAVCPCADYWTPVNPSDAKLLAWHGSNRFNSVLADELDVICPSLYAFYDDAAGWEKYAVANIEEAYRYDKPVIPFICPHYHHSNEKTRNTLIPYFGRILDVVRERCDGAILWGGWWFGPKDLGKGGDPGHPWPWDPNFPWLREVRRVARGLR